MKSKIKNLTNLENSTQFQELADQSPDEKTQPYQGKLKSLNKNLQQLSHGQGIARKDSDIQIEYQQSPEELIYAQDIQESQEEKSKVQNHNQLKSKNIEDKVSTNLIKINPIQDSDNDHDSADDQRHAQIPNKQKSRSHQKTNQTSNYDNPIIYEPSQNDDDSDKAHDNAPQSSRRKLYKKSQQNINSNPNKLKVQTQRNNMIMINMEDSTEFHNEESPKKLLNRRSSADQSPRLSKLKRLRNQKVAQGQQKQKQLQKQKQQKPVPLQKGRTLKLQQKFQNQQILYNSAEGQKQTRQQTEVYNYEYDQQSGTESEDYLSEQQSDEQDPHDFYQQEQQNHNRQKQKVLPKIKESKSTLISNNKQSKNVHNNLCNKTILKSQSFYTLINAQIPQKNFVKCIIKRTRSKQSYFFDKTVIYQCYLLQDRKHILTCVKDRFLNATSNFKFYRNYKQTLAHSNKSKMEQLSNLYGILNSNFTGTQYVFKSIVNLGDTNSQRATCIDKSQALLMMSREDQTNTTVSEKNNVGGSGKAKGMFGDDGKKAIQDSKLKEENIKQRFYVCFKANLFGLNGQRGVSLFRKNNKKLNKNTFISNTSSFSLIKAAIENGQENKYIQYQNRKAGMGKNGLELDFSKVEFDNIAKVQSNKNMILENQMAKEVFALGKIQQDIYSISIGSPLSILEGLAFGIANLDRKFFVS